MDLGGGVRFGRMLFLYGLPCQHRAIDWLLVLVRRIICCKPMGMPYNKARIIF